MDLFDNDITLDDALFTGEGFRLDPQEYRITPEGEIVYQVIATLPRLDGLIPAGERGGWITCVDNLHDDAWVADGATVLGSEVHIGGSAYVSGEITLISGNTVILGQAGVVDSFIEDCMISGHAVVRGASLDSETIIESERALGVD